jgi:hypothetical protein
MIALERATVYGRALFGEPLDRPLPHRVIDTDHLFWIVGEWPVVIPKQVVRAAPDVQRAIIDLRRWTGWSARRLADVLRTSHTTVRRIEAGRPLVEGHSGDLRRRLDDVHDVVGRVFLLCHRDPVSTVRVLEKSHGEEETAVDALRRGDAAQAYLRAIDAVRPRETGLLVGARPRGEGATAPFHD